MTAYARPHRLVHWFTAAGLVLLFGLGLSMTRMFDGDAKLRVYSWHEWTGITVFALTLARVWYSLRSTVPPPALPRAEAIARRLVHGAIYVLLVATPVTGWFMTQAFGFSVVYLGVVPLPNLLAEDRELAATLQRVHVVCASSLAALALLHLGAIARHEVVARDGMLGRMWPDG